MTETVRNMQMKEGAIPTHLSLHNFMSHKNTSIDLGDLTVIFSNTNGAGKTSLLEGLMYAYTGHTIRTMSKGFSINDIIRRGTQEAVVKVDGIQKDTTEDDVKSLYIERNRKTSGSDLVLRIDGNEINNPDEILENMTESKTFSRISLINGHDVLLFLEGTPKDRSVFLDRLFGIDIISSIKSELTTNPIDKEIYDINNKIAEAERLRAVLERSASAQGKIQQIENKIQELTERRNTMQDEYNQLREREEAAVQAVSEFEQHQQRKKDIVTDITHMQERIEEMERNISNLNTKIEGLSLSIREIISDRFGEADPDDIISEKEQRKSDLMQLIQTEDTVPAIIDNVIDAIRNRVEANLCPVCGKECTIEELEIQRTAFVGFLEGRRERLASLNDEITNLISAKRRIDRLGDKRRATEDQRNKLIADKRTLESELHETENTLESIEDLDEDDIQEQKDVLDHKESAVIRGKMSEIQEHIRSMQSELNDLRDGTGDVSEDDIPDIHELEHNKSALAELKEKFTRYKRIYTRVLKRSRQVSLDEINNMINVYLDTFNTTVVKNVKMQLEPKSYRGERYYVYDITAEDDRGRELPFNGLSTGQKSAVLISLILSINDTVQNKMPLVLFDEIQSSGLDDSSLKTFISMIITFAQVRNIVITSRDHDFIRDIQEELNRLDDEGNAVHSVSVNMYELELASEGDGIPLTLVSEYSNGA